jgi:LysR family transcriptional regulator, transcription activator of glutamate synthase operon
MNLLQLKYFKRVAELEHISKAAKQLMISQPSLTKTIRLLENELGVKLFDHLGNSIKLSQKGDVVLHYATQILQCVEEMHQDILTSSNNQEKTLSIGVKAAANLIPKYVLGFRKLFPDININISQITLEADNPKTLTNYHYVIYPSVEKPNKANIVTLLQEPCLIAFPLEHPSSSADVVDIKNCSKERFLILREKTPISEITNSTCLSAGFLPKIDIACDSWETIYSLIEAGMGIALLPSYTWNLSGQPFKITTRPLTEPVCRYINLIWQDDKPLSENAILFQKYLISFFQDLSHNQKH